MEPPIPDRSMEFRRLQDLARSDLTGESAARAAPRVINPTRSGPPGALLRHACHADREVPGRVAEPGPIVPRQVSARDLLRPEIGRDDQAAPFDECACPPIGSPNTTGSPHRSNCAIDVPPRSFPFRFRPRFESPASPFRIL
jgi:hypothetical protein